MRAYSKKHYEANRDKILESKRVYREANAEKLREYNREYQHEYRKKRRAAAE